MWYTFFKFWIFAPIAKLVWRAKVEGLEHVPAHGGGVIAANHVAAIDSIVIPAMMKRRMTYPAKAELFTGTTIPTKIVAWFLKAIGMVAMDRAGGRASVNSLGAVATVLSDGHLVGIFPEGTRSPDGRLYKGKTGVARLALSAGVPIIPVGLIGTVSVRRFLGINWPSKPRIIVGAPLTFDEYAGQTNDAKVLRYVTDETMFAIQQLTKQEYADVYGFRVKHGDLKETGSNDFVVERPGDGKKPEPRTNG